MVSAIHCGPGWMLGSDHSGDKPRGELASLSGTPAGSGISPPLSATPLDTQVLLNTGSQGAYSAPMDFLSWYVWQCSAQILAFSGTQEIIIDLKWTEQSYIIHIKRDSCIY